MKPQHHLLIVTIGFMIIGLVAAKGMLYAKEELIIKVPRGWDSRANK